MIFLGGLLLIPAWPLDYFPLMALGTWLRGCFNHSPAPTLPASGGGAVEPA
jgi:hypothetical protein